MKNVEKCWEKYHDKYCEKYPWQLPKESLGAVNESFQKESLKKLWGKITAENFEK